MCGIAGKLNFDGGPPVDRALLTAMLETIRHRGPDGDGMYLSGNVGLGHRRLAIIDLNTGQQPLCNEDRTVWITFNGEIYNYLELRDFLYKNLYYNEVVNTPHIRARHILEELFHYYSSHHNQIGTMARRRAKQEGWPRAICDYLAGMTDRYAMQAHERLIGSNPGGPSLVRGTSTRTVNELRPRKSERRAAC